MSLIEQIKADREAGTPGLWTLEAITSSDPNGDEWETDVEVLDAIGTHIHGYDLGYRDDTDARIKSNARRISRVPDMEAALIAAAELADAVDFVNEGGDQASTSQLMMCLNKFRALAGEGKT